MSTISKEEAYEVFSPYFPLFAKAVDLAWNSWVHGDVARRMQHKRVRANVIWNDYFYFMLQEIEKDEFSDVRFTKIPYNQGFSVNARYFIKFKKGDANFLSSNLPTQNALKFHDPNIDMFGAEVRLELLYVLDKDDLFIEKIVLVQRKDKYVAWAIDITEQSVVDVPEIFTQPKPQEAQRETAKKVIKSKKVAQNMKKAQNDQHD
ncbi:hypothetical protein [Proteus vulgaris]|uniref:hypothetical protein n=1 Tax=Proteus vulgaris TaxID=585 RepID=UPI0034D5619A